MSSNYRVQIELSSFASLDEATRFLGSVLTTIMSDWGNINPDGVSVTAAIKDGNGDEYGYCDTYGLQCG